MQTNKKIDSDSMPAVCQKWRFFALWNALARSYALILHFFEYGFFAICPQTSFLKIEINRFHRAYVRLLVADLSHDSVAKKERTWFTGIW